MLTNDINKISEIIVFLINYIKTSKNKLFELDHQITGDTKFCIEKDYIFIINYLYKYVKNNKKIIKNDNLKSKGKVLILLSYNEPFIMSIIPIINALVAGNDIIIKPSKRAERFIKNIWLYSGVVKKYNLRISFISSNNVRLARDLIKKVRAVYFFGSYKVARKIAKLCGENYVEFCPQIETADCKIYNNKLDIINIEKDVELTIKESFSHQGQICQRIQGVYVADRNYDNYLNSLKNKFLSSKYLYKYINKNYKFDSKLIRCLNRDIKKSSPREIVSLRKSLPKLVINPKINSDFINNAYFLPVLWISPFKTERQLIKLLNRRKFYLGINIYSNDRDFINNIIRNTKFTRYTVNSKHIKIRNFEGWGGVWPSGYSGYKNWIKYFSNPYIIIK